MDGTVSYFTSRKPTDNEIRNAPRLELTSQQDWNPHSNEFEERELAADDVNTGTNRIMDNDEENVRLRHIAQVSTKKRMTEIAPNEDEHFFDAIAPNECLEDCNCKLPPGHPCLNGGKDESAWAAEILQISAVRTNATRPALNPERLQTIWRIGKETARRTLNVTTQKGLRNIKGPVQS